MTEWDAELDAALLAETQIMDEIRTAQSLDDETFRALARRGVAASERVQAALQRRLDD